MSILLINIPLFLWEFWSNRQTELESDLEETLNRGKKRLADFNFGKTQLVSFDWSNNTGAIEMKMDGFVLEEK